MFSFVSARFPERLRQPFSKAFEVDVHGVCKGQQIMEASGGEAAIGNKDSCKVCFLDEPKGIQHIFNVYEGFVIGKSKADAACFFMHLSRKGSKFFRGKDKAGGFPAMLGNFVILAERAGKIAAKTAGRKDVRSRVEVIEGFLLDGVKGKTGELSIGQAYQSSLLVLPCAAKADFTVSKAAVMMTKQAGQDGRHHEHTSFEMAPKGLYFIFKVCKEKI